jgi:hypothetical protein
MFAFSNNFYANSNSINTNSKSHRYLINTNIIMNRSKRILHFFNDVHIWSITNPSHYLKINETSCLCVSTKCRKKLYLLYISSEEGSKLDHPFFGADPYVVVLGCEVEITTASSMNQHNFLSLTH